MPLKARHAEDIGATAIGLMATSYFTPKSVGVYSFPPHKAAHSEMILFFPSCKLMQNKKYASMESHFTCQNK